MLVKVVVLEEVRGIGTDFGVSFAASPEGEVDMTIEGSPDTRDSSMEMGVLALLTVSLLVREMDGERTLSTI